MTTFFKKALLLLTILFVHAAALMAQSYADGLAAVQLKDWDKAIGIFSAIAQADAADQDHEDRDDVGKDGPFDEKFRDHGRPTSSLPAALRSSRVADRPFARGSRAAVLT